MVYTADELRQLFRLIDWMMHLRPDLEQEFETRLHAYEEEIRMPYVTSIERNAEARGVALGEARGVALGEARGRLLMVIEILEARLGPLPADLSLRLRDLSDTDRDEFLVTFVRNGFENLGTLTDWVSRR
jgi:hypothetical protein